MSSHGDGTMSCHHVSYLPDHKWIFLFETFIFTVRFTSSQIILPVDESNDDLLFLEMKSEIQASVYIDEKKYQNSSEVQIKFS